MYVPLVPATRYTQERYCFCLNVEMGSRVSRVKSLVRYCHLQRTVVHGLLWELGEMWTAAVQARRIQKLKEYFEELKRYNEHLPGRWNDYKMSFKNSKAKVKDAKLICPAHGREFKSIKQAWRYLMLKTIPYKIPNPMSSTGLLQNTRGIALHR